MFRASFLFILCKCKKKKQNSTFKKVHVYCTRVTIDLKELGKSVYLAKSVLEGFFFLWCARKSILRQEPT